MSVMLMTSFVSYPRLGEPAPQPEREDETADAFPTWMRWYTVGPHKYIPIGPGGGGSSTSERVNVS